MKEPELDLNDKQMDLFDEEEFQAKRLQHAFDQIALDIEGEPGTFSTFSTTGGTSTFTIDTNTMADNGITWGDGQFTFMASDGKPAVGSVVFDKVKNCVKIWDGNYWRIVETTYEYQEGDQTQLF